MTDETKDIQDVNEDENGGTGLPETGETAAGKDAEGESTFRSEGGDSSDGAAGVAMGGSA